MADDTQQQPPDEAIVQVFGGTRYDFVTNLAVTQPGLMVYLDFYQQDPRNSEEAAQVAQLVMHPSLAQYLVEKLSAVRQDPPTG